MSEQPPQGFGPTPGAELPPEAQAVPAGTHNAAPELGPVAGPAPDARLKSSVAEFDAAASEHRAQVIEGATGPKLGIRGLAAAMRQRLGR